MLYWICFKFVRICSVFVRFYLDLLEERLERCRSGSFGGKFNKRDGRKKRVKRRLGGSAWKEAHGRRPIGGGPKEEDRQQERATRRGAWKGLQNENSEQGAPARRTRGLAKIV